jgi:hypothetical protein
MAFTASEVELLPLYLERLEYLQFGGHGAHVVLSRGGITGGDFR